MALFVVVTAVPAAAKCTDLHVPGRRREIVLSDRQIDPTAILRPMRLREANPFRATKGVVSERAARYESLIEENAAAHGVNPHLVRAVIQQESAFNPNARSNKGAMGLMQLMPATAAELGVTDPYNPSENIRGGVAYLKGLLVKFQQNVELALAAYNAGPTAVTKYGAVPPYRETRNYVLADHEGRRSRRPSRSASTRPSRSSTAAKSPATRLSRRPARSSWRRPSR